MNYNMIKTRRNMLLCLCSALVRLLFLSANIVDARFFLLPGPSLIRSAYDRIMTMGSDSRDDVFNPPGPAPTPATIAPPTTTTSAPTTTALPATTQNNIPTTHPTIRPPNPTKAPSTPTRNGVAVSIRKCEEYHDWLIRRSTFQFFIIKGTPAIGKEFPHMAALGYGAQNNIQWLCGGSLISEQYVLTAAHCLRSMEMGLVSWVRLGDNNLVSTNSETSQMFSVIERTAHPDYAPSSKYNDIALLKLDRPVEFSEYVLPICLSTSESDVHEKLIATGWGKTVVNGARSDTLMKVDLEYFPNDVCREAYVDVSKKDLPESILADKQICAGSNTDQRDTCQGDSGGPLQINTDKLYLIGITSFGKMCGLPNIPAIYTLVSYYIPWIEQIVWKNQ